MKKLPLLNLGCGDKFHESWVNVDMVSHSKHVRQANLIKGIPYSESTFEAVYHSQVLEHIPKTNAPSFIGECFRVLKPGGIIRVVVPDLENIALEYLKQLESCLDNPTAINQANYDWVMLEFYDQAVRNESGGMMANYIKQDNLINEKYVLNRTGRVGHQIRENYLKKENRFKKAMSSWSFFKRGFRYAYRKALSSVSTKSTNVGRFRMGGEIHMWMYDRFSLERLLNDCGFIQAKVMDPFKSDIPNWPDYELDVRNDLVCDPTSLFMEAKKP